MLLLTLKTNPKPNPKPKLNRNRPTVIIPTLLRYSLEGSDE